MENKRTRIQNSFGDQDLFNCTPMGNSIMQLLNNSLAPNNFNKEHNHNIAFDSSLDNIANNDVN